MLICRAQVVDSYQRLHLFGIVHGDVSRSNLCRITRRSTDGDGNDGTAIAIIDFGLAFISRRAPLLSTGGGALMDEEDKAETETFVHLATNELARVRHMLGI